MHKFTLTFIFLCFLGFLSTSNAQDTNPDAENQYKNAINMEFIDISVSPTDDFYQYVNGVWLKETEVPEDRGRWGSFDELRKTTSKNTIKALEDAANDNKLAPGSPEHKAVTFYKLAMDTAYLDKLGLEPVMPYIKAIEKIQSKDEVFDYIGENMPIAGNPLFVFFVRSSFTNSSINALYLTSSGLGMPDREYYLKDDEKSIKTQEKYREMLTEVFHLLDNGAESEGIAEDIFSFEKNLAEHRMTKEMRRNPDNMNNVLSIEELSDLFPSANFSHIMKKQGIDVVEEVTVTDPGYFKGLKEVFENADLGTIKSYMKWMVLHSYKDYLNSDMENTSFKFYGEQLSGTKVMLPRWERVLNTANRALDQAIGRLYVDAYFPPEAKEIAQELVDNVKEAFGERIKALDWMTDTTKLRALEKLSKFNVKIAYPDEWKDYSKLDIVSQENNGSYAGNMMLVSQWNWEKKKKDINQAVDKSEWFMGPQIVNAYFSPSFNEIVFPAAILQAPFFDFKADPAVNYGGIGAVIGHEISHGFDDSGSKYDASGNLNNWWTNKDREAFEERTDALVAQFDNYKPFDDLAVNGKFTLGENIGDLGGVNVAYQALQQHLAEHNDVPEKIDGFTQSQRFFMSWATIWRTKFKDEALRTQIKTDPHAPGMYRAVGPIINMDEFHNAFDVKEGDKMFKSEDERVKIW